MAPECETPSQCPVVVVIPTYNEVENLPIVVSRILALSIVDLHILVVDDASPDGTGACADALAREHAAVHVLHRTMRGRASAGLDGFRWALAHGAALVVEMDADLSHAPEDIPRLLNAVQHTDIACGSRYIGGEVRDRGAVRNLLTAVINVFNRVVLRLPVRDISGGFKCYRRAALERIGLERVISTGYSIGAELLYRAVRAGCTLREIPIVFHNRIHGVSKCTWRIAVNYVWTVLRVRLTA